MDAVSVYDLTDEQIEAALRLRRASTPSEVRSVWRAAESRPPIEWPEPTPANPAPARRCTRCGIDTTRPDLCVDCEDVLVLNADEWRRWAA